ncbi:hypothetical protein [Pseudomonas sp. ADAK22]|uniref:hypothetical protein n=1 Tax=Pseudomonas sp. ADAK22 TaxID=2730851 RepID=UPI001F37825D|nr:hypothetical protein [Pseudomonas sp. ADAK22]
MKPQKQRSVFKGSAFNAIGTSPVKYAICATLLLSLSGCLTMSGEYTVTAHDASGAQITRLGTFTAEGHNIYPIRNAFCLNAPGATVIIRDARTGEELRSEALITAVKPQKKGFP